MCNLGKYVRTIRVPKSKPLVGYRGWRRGLHSMFKNYNPAWSEDGVNVAHANPSKDNEAGLYAFKTPAAFKAGFKYVLTSRALGGILRPNPTITGSVELWGTVAVHKNGYRASHARIKKIIKGKTHVRIRRVSCAI